MTQSRMNILLLELIYLGSFVLFHIKNGPFLALIHQVITVAL